MSKGQKKELLKNDSLVLVLARRGNIVKLRRGFAKLTYVPLQYLAGMLMAVGFVIINA